MPCRAQASFSSGAKVPVIQVLISPTRIVRRTAGQVSTGQRSSSRAPLIQVLKLGAGSTSPISQSLARSGRPASRCARASLTRSPPRGSSLRPAAAS